MSVLSRLRKLETSGPGKYCNCPGDMPPVVIRIGDAELARDSRRSLDAPCTACGRPYNVDADSIVLSVKLPRFESTWEEHDEWQKRHVTGRHMTREEWEQDQRRIDEECKRLEAGTRLPRSK